MIVASLPMYDWPEFRNHTDLFWQALTKHMGWTGELNRTDFVKLWQREDLHFSQTCGYPFTHDFKGILRYVATPHYQVDGCEGANYCSILFAREQTPLADFYGATAAINATDSMSGMLALKLVIAPYLKSGEFFRRKKITGSHRNSLEAVRTKFADVCAVDSVCVGLARQHCPEILAGLVEVARSPMVPSLPFVTRSVEPALLVQALQKTFADESIKLTRDALLLQSYSELPLDAYDKILDLEKALPDFEL
jgi:ABC-type phosphate/phosphonate transport system substrate-binding protein